MGMGTGEKPGCSTVAAKPSAHSLDTLEPGGAYRIVENCDTAARVLRKCPALD